MADTGRGDFNVVCSDCGEMGCVFEHNGPLVPAGTSGYFCWFCWSNRQERSKNHGDCLPLGVQPQGVHESLSGRNLDVRTESGSIYHLTPTEKKDEYIIFRDEKEGAEDISFTRARVMRLEHYKIMVLKRRDGEYLCLFFTNPVIEITVFPED